MVAVFVYCRTRRPPPKMLAMHAPKNRAAGREVIWYRGYESWEVAKQTLKALAFYGYKQCWLSPAKVLLKTRPPASPFEQHKAEMSVGWHVSQELPPPNT